VTLKHDSARLVTGDIRQEIAKVKQSSQKAIMLFGSPRLTQSLAELDLIDEFLINVNPVLLGRGVRMFDSMPKTKLNLVSTTPFTSGVVGFHYRKAV
jgi:dihydrofolate reductase